jgi:hypothetical protein
MLYFPGFCTCLKEWAAMPIRSDEAEQWTFLNGAQRAGR